HKRRLSGGKFSWLSSGRYSERLSERGLASDSYHGRTKVKLLKSDPPSPEKAVRISEEKKRFLDDEVDIGSKIESIDSDIAKYEELLKSIREKNVKSSPGDYIVQQELNDNVSENLVLVNPGNLALKQTKAASLSGVFTFGVPKTNIWASEPHEPDKSEYLDSLYSLSEPPGISGIIFDQNLTETIYIENHDRAQQSTFQELQLNPSPQIFTYQEHEFYTENINTHSSLKPLIAQIIKKNNEEMQAKRAALQMQYKAYLDEWTVTTEKLETQLRKRNTRFAASSTAPLPISTSNTASNLLGPTFVQTNGNDTGRGSRRQNHVRDVARTEAEFEEILFNLSVEANNEDSTRLAIEPSQIISPIELQQYKDYVNNNSLVADPEDALRDFHNHVEFCWTESERHTFRTKLIQYGKNFHKIASAIPNKSTSDCVHYYYREKYTCNFKALLQQKYLAATLSSNSCTTSSRKRQKRTSEGPRSDEKKRRDDDETMTAADEARKARAELRAQQKDPKHASTLSSSPVTPASPFLDDPTANKNLQSPTLTTTTTTTTREKSGPWSEEEKRRLRNGIAAHGRNFGLVAAVVITRSEDQCRRYSIANKRAFPLPPLTPDEHDDEDEVTVAATTKRRRKQRFGNESNEDEERKRRTILSEKRKKDESGGEVDEVNVALSSLMPTIEVIPKTTGTQVANTLVTSSVQLPDQTAPSVSVVAAPQPIGLVMPQTMGAGPAPILSNTGQQQRRTVSYWSVAEKDGFLSSLDKYGRNWEAIAREIVSKTAIQARNYYVSFRVKLNLDRRLEENGHSTEDEKPPFPVSVATGVALGMPSMSTSAATPGETTVNVVGASIGVSAKVASDFLDRNVVGIASPLQCQSGMSQGTEDLTARSGGGSSLSQSISSQFTQLPSTPMRVVSPVQFQGYISRPTPAINLSSATSTATSAYTSTTTTTTKTTTAAAAAKVRVQQVWTTTPDYKPNDYRHQQYYYPQNVYYQQPGIQGLQGVVGGHSVQQQQYNDRLRYPLLNPQIPVQYTSPIPVGPVSVTAMATVQSPHSVKTTQMVIPMGSKSEMFPHVPFDSPPPPTSGAGVSVDPMRTLPSLKSVIGGVVGEEWSGGRKEDGVRLAPLQDVDDGGRMV
ncbi:nuclear receptor co-repressor 1, partial [Nowakowskiella sp. JEL0078]